MECPEQQVCRAGSHRGPVKSGGGVTNLISQEQQNCASPEGEGTPRHVFTTIFTATYSHIACLRPALHSNQKCHPGIDAHVDDFHAR